MLTVFVGDTSIELSQAAKKYDVNAYLINDTNYQQIHSGTCYTSLGDLPNNLALTTILRQADKIIYQPPLSWTNKKKKYSIQYWTEYHVYIFSLDRSKEVINCPTFFHADDLDVMLHLQDSPKVNSKHIWAAGCSITYGSYVDINKRYSNLIATQLNLPLVMLAHPGSSIRYAADQILRSDIQKNDLVIWGITAPQRRIYYDQESKKIVHINMMHINYKNKKFDLTDFTLLYDAVISIHQVVNFCNKIQAKLILGGILVDTELAAYLRYLKEYVHLHGFYGINSEDIFIDLGSDNRHPGCKMHEWYAKMILKKIEELK